jgi:N-acetylmuramoyl-L-alanine amidase
MKQPTTPQARFVELTTALNATQIAELQRKMNESQLLLPKEPLTADGLFGRRSRQRFNELAPSYGLAQLATGLPRLLDLEVISHPFAQKIKQNHLSTEQYFPVQLPKTGVLLHHTVSGANPNDVRDFFERSRERVGTHFCIGGDTLQGNTDWDGHIIQLFPLLSWAHHINTSMFNEAHNQKIIGVEICRWGMLDKEHNSYSTKSSKPQSVPDYQVEILSKKFNGGTCFHKYSIAQSRAVLELLCYLRDIFKFDYSQTNWNTMFNRNANMIAGRENVAITAHTTWRSPNEKSDIYPAERMRVVIEAVKQFDDVNLALSFFNNNIK